MKRRMPGWLSWFMLLWLGCLVIPDSKGNVRLNLLVALNSWTYGLMGLDLGLSFWAGFSRGVYWDPYQLALACLTGLFLGLAGLLLGGFVGLWVYKVERTSPIPDSTPTVDAYPTDPRRESSKIEAPRNKEVRTVLKPIGWRVLFLLLTSVMVAIGGGRSLKSNLLRPVMSLRTEEIEARNVRDWEATPLAEGFAVDMPGRPERQGDWMVLSDPMIGFAVTTIPTHGNEAAWRLNFWGEMLGNAPGLTGLHPCRQAGLDGIEGRYPGEMLTSRMLIGPHQLFVLQVRGSEEDLRAAQFLNSFRKVSK